MDTYKNYIAEIEERKSEGLHPKPIDDSTLLSEIIGNITNLASPHRKDCLKFFLYNVLPGTTSAAQVKADFLKALILGNAVVEEISQEFAFELLSHMKGGPSVAVLLDLALADDEGIALKAADVLKTQVFLYDADMERLATAYKDGKAVAKGILDLRGGLVAAVLVVGLE